PQLERIRTYLAWPETILLARGRRALTGPEDLHQGGSYPQARPEAPASMAGASGVGGPELPPGVAAEELLVPVPGPVVAVLHRRRLHEVRGRGEDRATDAAVLRDLRSADRVDDDARRVRRVPDLELVLEVQRGVTERAALQPDVGPLAV